MTSNHSPAHSARAAASGPGTPTQTHVDEPGKRIFLPQTVAGRAASLVWSVVRVLLFHSTPNVFNGWRRLLLRLFGARVHPSAFIDRTARIHFPWNLTIGPNVRIFHRVVINCMGPIEIGSGAKLSQDTHLCAGTHAYKQTHMPIHPTPIKIGSDVWLAADVFIGPGVSIGDRAIIGARASVFRDIPPNVIAYGDPAKPVRSRDEDRPTDE